MSRRLFLPAAVAALAFPAAAWFATAAAPRPDPVEPSLDLEAQVPAMDFILAQQTPDSILAEAAMARIEETLVEVQSGDTLMALLQSAGVSSEEAHTAIAALSEVYSPRKLRPGQQIQVALLQDSGPPGLGEGDDRPKLSYISLRESAEADIRVERNGDGFAAETVARQLEREILGASGSIDSSLYAAAVTAGVPDPVILEAIHTYSYAIDFQRDPRGGDPFELIYERFLDDQGQVAKTGDLLFASLTVQGREIDIYRYTTQEGQTDYFTPEGESIRRLLMRTPIDGARISSGFGMRRHPIRGYSRMHKGTDFAAPTGTPIYAAGNGVVERANRFGGYGNYIRIRHNGAYSTAYAHMQRFAEGIAAGTRVEQGQVIGYVGSTGASTGPHLHYEVLVNGQQTNPQSIELPTGVVLSGAEKDRFRQHRAEVDRLREDHISPRRMIAQQACATPKKGEVEAEDQEKPAAAPSC